MYYYRDMYGGSLLQMTIVVCAIAVFLMIRAVIFIIRTFVAYPKKVSLWIALAISLVSLILGALLYKLTAFTGWFSLGYLGTTQLLVVCYIIDLKNRDTFMAEKPGLVDQILHQSWWASEDTPLEVENDQLAA